MRSEILLPRRCVLRSALYNEVMKSTRDAQRTAVYDAERCMELTHAELGYVHGKGWTKPAMTISQCRKLVEKVLADSEVNAEWSYAGNMRITVEASSGGGGGKAVYRSGLLSIELGTWARQPHVVLHEIAHHLAGNGAAHGPDFVSVCLWLTHRFMGNECGEALRSSYVKHGVQYGRREPAKQLRKTQRITKYGGRPV